MNYAIPHLTNVDPLALTFPNHRFNAVVSYFGSLVPHSYSSTSYPSFEAMKADYEATGRIKVNVDHSENTIFASPSVNWLFRAWHDSAHIRSGGDFSEIGEMLAVITMMGDLTRMPDLSKEEVHYFSRLIWAEVVEQSKYYFENNKFVENQKAFTLGWLKDNFGYDIPASA